MHMVSCSFIGYFVSKLGICMHEGLTDDFVIIIWQRLTYLTCTIKIIVIKII